MLHTKVQENRPIGSSLIAAFCSRELNQMTNVPVNTHLIFGPTLCTKTSFAKFDIVLKWVKVNTGSSFI